MDSIHLHQFAEVLANHQVGIQESHRKIHARLKNQERHNLLLNQDIELATNKNKHLLQQNETLQKNNQEIKLKNSELLRKVEASKQRIEQLQQKVRNLGDIKQQFQQKWKFFQQNEKRNQTEKHVLQELTAKNNYLDHYMKTLTLKLNQFEQKQFQLVKQNLRLRNILNSRNKQQQNQRYTIEGNKGWKAQYDQPQIKYNKARVGIDRQSRVNYSIQRKNFTQSRYKMQQKHCKQNQSRVTFNSNNSSKKGLFLR